MGSALGSIIATIITAHMMSTRAKSTGRHTAIWLIAASVAIDASPMSRASRNRYAQASRTMQPTPTTRRSRSPTLKSAIAMRPGSPATEAPAGSCIALSARLNRPGRAT